MADQNGDTPVSPVSSTSYSSMPTLLATSSKGTNASAAGGQVPATRKQSHGGARTAPETSATKVFVRVRPFNDREQKLQERGQMVDVIVHVDEKNPSYITTLDPAKGLAPRDTYVFEHCFNSALRQSKTLEEANQAQLSSADMEACGRDQHEVYCHVGHPVLENAIKGYNGCVFAYGQTGSGKTFTMMGPPEWAGFVAQTSYTTESSTTGFSLDFSALPSRPPVCSSSQAPTPRTPRGSQRTTRSRAGTVLSTVSDNTSPSRVGAASELAEESPSLGVEGIVPRLSVELFKELNRKRLDDSSHSFRVEMEYYEIYNEKVMDLLRTGGSAELRIRNSANGPYVENLTRKTVLHANDIFKLLLKGNAERHTASTKMNDRSSRSHAVLSLSIVQVTLADDDSSSKLSSKINLVDLAGSERTGASGVAGQQFKEATKINLSLTTLGRVIDALADMSQGKHGVFCPYRDSNLTWLLMDSLGGNSKTTMVATVSPHPVSFEETCQTLRYASRAKQIVTRATINEDPQARQIRLLQAEVQRLQGLLNGDDDGRDDYVEELKERLAMLQAELDVKTAELDHTYEELAALRSLRTAAQAKSTSGAATAGAGGQGGNNAKELLRLREEVNRLEAENLLLANTEKELHDAREQARRAEAKINQLSLVLRSTEKKASDAQAATRRLDKEARETQKLKDRLKKLSHELAESNEREEQLREAIHNLEEARAPQATADGDTADPTAARRRSVGGGGTISTRLQRMQSLSGGSAPLSTSTVHATRRRSSAGNDATLSVAAAEKAATEWKLCFEQEQALHSANKQRLKEKQAVVRDLEAQLKAMRSGQEEARRASLQQKGALDELDKTQSMLIETELALGRSQLEASTAQKAKRELQRQHAEELAALTEAKLAITRERDDLAAKLQNAQAKADSDLTRAQRQYTEAATHALNEHRAEMQQREQLNNFVCRVSRDTQAGLLQCYSTISSTKEDYVVASTSAVLEAAAAALAERLAASEAAHAEWQHAVDGANAGRDAALAERDRVAGEVTTLTAQVGALQTQVSTLEQAMADLRTAHAREAEGATVARDALQEAQSEMKAQQDSAAEQLAATVAQYEDAARARDADFQEVRRDLTSKLEAAEAALREVHTALEADRDAHAARLASMQEDGSAARAELDSQRNLLESALSDLAAAQRGLAESEAAATELTERLATSEAAHAEWQHAVDGANAGRDAALAERDRVAGEVTTLTAQVGALQTQVSTLEQAMADLRTAHAREADDALALHDRKLSELTEAHNTALADAATAHQTEKAALQTQLRRLGEEAESLRTVLEEAQRVSAEDTTKASETVATLQQSLHAAEEARQASEQEAASLRATLSAVRAEAAQLNESLDRRVEEIAARETARDQAHERAANAEESLAAAQKDVSALQTQATALNEQVRSLQEHARASDAAAQDTINSLRASLLEAEAARDATQSTLANSETQRRLSEAKVASLTAQLEAAQRDCQAATEALVAAREYQAQEEARQAQVRQQLEAEVAQREKDAAEKANAHTVLVQQQADTASALATCQAALDDAQEAHRDLAQRLAEVEAQRARDTEALATVREELATRAGAVAKLQDTLEEVQDEKAALAVRLKDLASAHDALKAQLAEQKADWQTRHDEEAQRAAKAEETLSLANEEVRATQRAAAEAESALRTQIIKLEGNVATLREELATAACMHAEKEESARRAHEDALQALQQQVTQQAAERQQILATLADREAELADGVAARAAADAETLRLASELRDANASLDAVRDKLANAQRTVAATLAEQQEAQKTIEALQCRQNQVTEEAAKELADSLAKTKQHYAALLKQQEEKIAQLSEDLEFRANLDLCDEDASAPTLNRSIAEPSGAAGKGSGQSRLRSLFNWRAATGTSNPVPDNTPGAGEMSSELTRRSVSFDPIRSFGLKPGPAK